MILYGKIVNVQGKKDWTTVTVSRPARRGAKGASATEEQITVWYKNANNLLEKASSLIGEERMLLVSHKMYNGEEKHFGLLPPMSYGFITSAPEMVVKPEDNWFTEAEEAVNDCEDAGLLPDEVSVDFTSADSLASIVAMLANDRSTVAVAAKKAIWRIANMEYSGYLGRIGAAFDNGSNFRITFKTPSKLGEDNSSEEEWNTVTFFGEYAEFLKKLKLQKGDKVFLTMGEKELYNGKPSYKGIALKKL
jgi:hypothetical protein